ncbi:4-hydroxythreonine-4-phosphate dehydrogenase PdxA [Horticoccus sp. 23ND18S-11]|uniref:4-hydroxythreonine-4-phosphate dehydrogenase PdxA n=1 Tax=Horticoccus sp. 23ND18S-11 TaxID=3391832 RepID=UPI0039C93DEC
MTARPTPLLALTLGDAAGTGPELITRACCDPEVRAVCRPVVIGDAATVRAALAITRAPARVEVIGRPAEASDDPTVISVIDLANLDAARLERGQVSAITGRAAYESIRRAVELTLDGSAQAVVTSAINKAALHAAGFHYAGHTELLAELCGGPKVTMMLVAGKLRVCHVSTHVSLAQAIARVRPERILQVVQLAHDGLRQIGIARPHLAVAGLNPHAGEGGLFGTEEIEFIVPAVDEARRRGFHVSGPFAGDTVFFRTLQGEFDGAIAMYHDQGHVAAKMLGIWQGVNVTLGLPIIRTSVEHGTDFANAGRGTGDPRSLVQALKLAATMAAHRVGPPRSA